MDSTVQRGNERHRRAVERASAPFAASPDEVRDALLLDVRRASVYEEATEVAEGARWLDPARAQEWAATLPRDRRVVVYCVHGHEVSQATALCLRAAGVDAWFLRGGFDAWKAAGRPVQPKRSEEVA